MNRFRLIVLTADIAGLTIALFFAATPAQSKQCSTERPSNARSYWSYRLIDGRKCWYEGKPMLSKSSLHWPTSRAAQVAPRPMLDITPANYFNLLDAQASIPADPAIQPKSERTLETVDASPSLTPLMPDQLRRSANSVATTTAEAVVTILDRWPNEELPQHRNKPAPVEEPSLVNARTIFMATIMVMALLALLFHLTMHRRSLSEA